MAIEQLEAPPPPRIGDSVLVEIKSTPFVDEKNFNAEVRRLDSNIVSIKEAVEKQDDKFTRAFEKLEARFDKIDQRFEKIDQRFEKVDQRFEKMDQKFDQKFDTLVGEMKSNFKWMAGIYLTSMGVLLTAFYAFFAYMR